MEKIHQAYAKKGYYLARVSYHIETTEAGEAKLVFDVQENQGVIVRRVEVMGNKVFKDSDLRSVIKTKSKGPFAFVTGSGKYNEDQLKQDAMMLTFHYLNHGYLKVKVLSPKVSISKDKRYIFVTFQISEGKQYKISKVTMSGDVLTTKEELLSLLKTKTGNVYSQRYLEEDMQLLSDRYGDEGFAYANIVPQTVPNDETLTADINLAIEKGKRITIERINITGNTTTRDKVIRREIRIKENDRYSERLLRESRTRLMQLGYFEEVNFATPRGSRDDTMVINVSVKEKPTGSFNIGVGFSSLEQFIFNASVSKENFFGYGISGTVSAELSKKRQMFFLSARDPYFLDTEWMLGGEVYRSAYQYIDFRRVAMGGDLSLGHRFFDDYSADLGYQIENVSLSNFSFAVPQLFRDNASGLTSAMNLSLSRDTRDNRIVPRAGTYAVFTNELSGTVLGGDNDFYRTNFRFMAYEPLFKKKLVFKQFGRIGYIRSLNDHAVPLFERFFVGGPYSLRGFYPNSVGPRLRIPQSPSGSEDEFVYGGDKLLLLIGELEWWLYEPAGISLVAFLDAGNAFAEQENYSITNIRADYGFGMRWNSPMGPMRFEWGIPIHRRPNENSVVFNFTIGNMF
jgi:outer membrane protein insertion porin family